MFGTKTVKIDSALYDRLSELASQAGYASTGELIKHVLERETAALEASRDDKLVQDQLRGLGYLE
jgi:ferritin-like metal-binding protein YciE